MMPTGKRIVIYTALTGGYDNLLQPKCQRGDCEYVCFSNDISETSVGVWQIRPIPYGNNDPTRVSRFPKINPHTVFPDFESSLYIDANIDITCELYDAMESAMASGTPCAMIRHPERTCIYDEARALLNFGLGEPEKIYEQMKDIRKRGFQAEKGLYVCSIIFRKHNLPAVRCFDEAWWRDYCVFSKRDQLSVMPALAEANLKPEELIGNNYIAAHIHRHSKPHRHGNLWHAMNFLKRRWYLMRLDSLLD